MSNKYLAKRVRVKNLSSVKAWGLEITLAQKQETLFRKKVLAVLKTFPKTFIVPIAQRSIRGTPDILLCIRGSFFGLELKASPKSKISELQRFNIAQIVDAGGNAFILYPENSHEILNLLRRFAFDENQGNPASP